MLPLLPILILLLLGPANAERLAVEGRLPAALARHLTPARATVVAPAEVEAPGTAEYHSADGVPLAAFIPSVPRLFVESVWENPGAPTRAGP